MLVPRDQVKDGEKYLVPDHFRVDLWDNKEYMWMEFLPLESKEVLQNLNTSEANILLSLFSVPVQCTVKDWCVYTKTLQDDINLKILQIFFTPPEQHEYIADAVEKHDSPQDHKDIMLWYISWLESLFPIQESDEDQDKITQLLDTVYTDIEQILNVHAETDSKDDTLDKIETRLRNFLLTIPHHVHANITIETDGSLHQVLIEARNYLDKKFVSTELEDNKDIELGNEIMLQKRWYNAIEYLRNVVFSFNLLFVHEPTYDPNQIDWRVLKLFDAILKNISSFKNLPESGEDTRKNHSDLALLFNDFWDEIFEGRSWEDSKQRTIISFYNNMSETEGAVINLLELKDYSESSLVSVKSLFRQLVQSVDDDTKESILQSLEKFKNEQLKDLDSNQLNKLLEMILDREDYIFAARIRDIIDPKE